MTDKDRIQEIIKDLAFIKSKKRHLEALKIEREELLLDFKETEYKLNQLYIVIEKLENVSVKSIVTFMSGRKYSKLKESREEYSKASMSMRAKSDKIELLDYEINVLENKLDDESALENELERLMNQRDRAIMKGSSVREELKRLQQDIITHEKEISKTLSVQEYVIEYRRQIYKMLERLNDDTIAKEERLENAVSLFPLCNTRFKEMKREVVKINIDLSEEELFLYSHYGKRQIRLSDNNVSAEDIYSRVLTNFNKYKDSIENVELEISIQLQNIQFKIEKIEEKIKTTAGGNN